MNSSDWITVRDLKGTLRCLAVNKILGFDETREETTIVVFENGLSLEIKETFTSFRTRLFS